MLALPSEIIAMLHEFAPVFSRRLWPWVQVLVIGAILAPGKRTVTAVLRVMGLSQEAQSSGVESGALVKPWLEPDSTEVVNGGVRASGCAAGAGSG